MPELPEVETVIRQVKPYVIGKPIKNFSIYPGGHRLIGDIDEETLRKQLLGRSFTEISRFGKFIIMDLDDENQIIAHLRMSGMFRYSDSEFDHKHIRLKIHFTDNSTLNFIDIRRFATFHYLEKGQDYKGLTNLGMDALASELDHEYLLTKLKNRSKSIYSTLLDQSIIAGVGNIYANEALFASSIHPDRRSDSLTQLELHNLIVSVQKILNSAITHKGTTLIDKSFRGVTGEYGKFNKKLKVYGRGDKKCLTCTSPIVRARKSNRSYYFCPFCQKLTD